MSARRSSQPSVQLFPFLAVLMCALGALILMLLVTTSRMRDQARAAHAQRMSIATVSRAPSTVRLPPPRARWQPSSRPPDVTLLPDPSPRTPVSQPPEESLRAQWLRTVMDLEAAAAAEEAALQQRRIAAETEDATSGSTESQLANLQREADALAQRRAAAKADADRNAERQSALERAIAEQSAELEHLQVQQTAAASQFSILPYDGRTGTVRRPIYIECTDTGLTFAAEGITLTPEQLNGFPALRNPLLAGADALIDYWSLKGLQESASNPPGQPYVLLIVRPSGTIGYYVARRMLDALGQPFGYELVPEDLEMAWPASDPGAVKACQAAIDAALHNREHLAGRGGGAPPGSLEPLSVSNGHGAFALDEVERLRGSDRTVHFGGRTFDRATAGNGLPSPGTGRNGTTAAEAFSADRTEPAPAPFPGSGTTAPGELAANGTPSQSGEGPPSSVTSPSAAAAEAAAAFSAEAAARSGRSSFNQNSGNQRDDSDDTPRPPPSLDAVEMGARPSSRTASRNPGAVLRDPGSQIGLERKVNIRVEAQRVIVESEPPITVTAGMSREELQALLAQSLRTHFEGWGRPPRSFYWLPEVKYSVLPGGHQNLKRLTDLTEEWEISSKIDYALE
jgi:hypothetical protein